MNDDLSEHAALLAELMRRVRSLDRAQWAGPRAPEKWSPAQEIEHLALSYANWAAEIRDGPVVTPETFAERLPGLRERVLPRILAGGWFPVGGRAPSGVVPREAGPDPEALLGRLRQNAAEFEGALLAEAATNAGRYLRHPYFGALTLSESFRVCIEHTRHHMMFLPVPDRGPDSE